MAAVLPVDIAADDLEDVPNGAGPAVTIHHVLDCLAGFLRTQAEAEQLLAELRQTHGLAPQQLRLLGPTAASWLRLRRRAHQWSRGPHAQAQRWRTDSWTAAGLGGVLAGLVGIFIFPFDDDMTALALLFVLMLAVGTGAACGKVWADSLSLPAKHRKFDDVIRQQLANERWVVLAQGVPWARQAAVVESVRRLSLGWCGVSSGARWK